MFQAAQPKLDGKTVGVVFGTYAPMHRGHLDTIMRAKRENDAGCLVIASGFQGDRGKEADANLNFKRRFRYIRELFAKDPLVAVYGLDEDECGISGLTGRWDEWLEEFEKLLSMGVTSTTVPHFYVSEPQYAEELAKRGWGVTLMTRDNPISATKIRANPYKHWDEIVGPFKRVFSTNILITGTASEGKTTLVQDLGLYYGAPFSTEWGRDYIEDSAICEQEVGTADFMAFLEGQYNMNKELINSPANNGLFFADTDALVTEMYAWKYYNDPNFKFYHKIDGLNLIQNSAWMYAEKSRWDAIFLVSPRNEFVDDGVRYMGHGDMEVRKDMYAHLKANIEIHGRYDTLVELNGTYFENFTTIKNYVDGVIRNGKN